MANKKELIDKLERLHKQLEDVNDNTSYQEAKQNMELVGEIFSLVAPPSKIVFDIVVGFGKIGADILAKLVVGNYFKEGKIENFQFSDKELKSDEIDLLI